MFTIAICDDEPQSARLVETLLKESGLVPREQHIAKFLDPFALEFYIEKVKGQLDIVFLDIELGEESGIAAAIRICEKYPQIKVIFITGYIEYARTMMDARPVYFLTKPVQESALRKAMSAAKESLLADPAQTIAVNVKGSIISISLRDIIYMESDKRTVTIHGISGTRTVYARLKELADRLPPTFCHCHKSFIVSLEKVRHMDKKAFLMTTGDFVPISQTKYKKAREQFIAWLGDVMV